MKRIDLDELAESLSAAGFCPDDDPDAQDWVGQFCSDGGEDCVRCCERWLIEADESKGLDLT